MPYIGLTGNFGTGKSTVLNLFEQFGSTTISADLLVAEILQRPTTINAIASLLGHHVIKDQGELDKGRIASIIFDDSEKRKQVESIIHPLVFDEADKIYKQAQKKKLNPLVVFEVPLLFERGYEKHFDKTILVYCTKEITIKRLIAKGFSKEESLKRIRVQMPLEEKVKKADYIIDNSFSVENTKKQIEKLFISNSVFNIS